MRSLSVFFYGAISVSCLALCACGQDNEPIMQQQPIPVAVDKTNNSAFPCEHLRAYCVAVADACDATLKDSLQCPGDSGIAVRRCLATTECLDGDSQISRCWYDYCQGVDWQ